MTRRGPLPGHTPTFESVGPLFIMAAMTKVGENDDGRVCPRRARARLFSGLTGGGGPAG
jgi:hypothetical protein